MFRMSMIFLLAAFVVLVGTGDSQAYYLGPNSVGVYTVPDPTFDDPNDWYDLTCVEGAGLHTAYIVLLDPWNTDDGHAINIVGGFEFRLEYPSSTFVTPSLHPSAVNFQTFPDLYCGAYVPVSNGQALLVTLSIGTFDAVPREFFITPVSDAGTQSMPGSIVITDADDYYSIAEAFPSSGSFDLPVFRMNDCDVVEPPLTWSVGIGALGDLDNVAGVHPFATDTYDAEFDLADNNTTVTFMRPEWSAPYTVFRSDVRADYDPLAEAKTWPFRVNVPTQSGSELITVNFSPSFGSSSGWNLVLTDVTAGTTHDLWNDLSYGFDSYGGPRDFELMVGDPDAATTFSIGWEALSVSQADRNNVVGTDEQATDGFDPLFDIPEPGPPPSNFLIASVERPGWPLGPRFEQDIQGMYDPLTDVRTWPLLIETDEQSGEITLNFNPSFSASSGINFMLHDERTGETYSLFPSLSYRFPTGYAIDYRFTLIVGDSPMPGLTPTVREVAAGWSLIAPPLLQPGGYTMGDVFDQAGGPAYAFSFEPGSQGTYERQYATDPFTVGDGRWLAVTNDFTWSMVGDPVVVPAYIPLSMDWNLMGYPLWFPGPVEGVRVVRGGLEVDYETALLNNWVTAFMGYDQATDDYYDVLSIGTWHGYWIAALDPDILLLFDWRNFVTMPGRLSDPKEIPLPPEKDWRCQLVLNDGSDRSPSAILGVHEDASNEFDAFFDRPRPPATPTGGSTIVLIRPEWDKPTIQNLAKDIIAPLEGNPVAWTARITTDKPGQVELRWLRMGWPEDLDFQLYIPHQNRVVVRSMRATDSVTLTVETTLLDVIVRSPDELSGTGDLPFVGYRVAAHPNPFNPRTTISFDLPRDGRASVRVYNVRGQLVAELDGGTMSAGPNRIVWDGQDRSGRGVSSGVYFARLTLDGASVGTTARLSLVR